MLPPGAREGFVDAAGVRLHVVEAGPAAGPLVVLLHGFPEFWYGWRSQSPVIWGVADRFLGPELAEASVARCARGELVRVEGATHWVQHEHPDRVNREILDFLP